MPERLDAETPVLRWRVPLIVLALPAVLVLLVGTTLVFQAHSTGDSLLFKFARFLDPNGEANVWSWYSSVLLFALAVIFGVKAVARRAAGATYWSFGFLAIVAVYLSLDEATQLHERAGNLAAMFPGATWVIFGIPLAIVVGALCVWLLRRERRAFLLRLVVAGVVYLFGAVGVEFVANLAPVGATYPLWTALEEVFEIAGVLIALWAALRELDPRLTPTGVRIPA